MKKAILLGLSVLLLSGCAFLAKASLEHGMLATGQTVALDEVKPAADWGCRKIGMTTMRNSSIMNTGSFTMGSSTSQIVDYAVHYANTKNLKPNYIYIQKSAPLYVGGVNVKMGVRTRLHYYICKKINPHNKLHFDESTTIH